jgi:hypothetical protein
MASKKHIQISRKLETQLWSQVGVDRLGTMLREQVANQLYGQIGNQLWSQIGFQLERELSNK